MRSMTISAPTLVCDNRPTASTTSWLSFAPLQLAYAQERLTAQPRQRPTQFRLEHHDQRDGRIGRQGRQDRMQQLQLGPDRHGVNQAENAQAQQHVHRAAAADDHQKLINEDRDNDDVNGRGDGELRQIRNVDGR